MSYDGLTILQAIALRKMKTYGEKYPSTQGWMDAGNVRLRMKMTTVNSLVERGLVVVNDGCFRISTEGKKLLVQEPEKVTNASK